LSGLAGALTVTRVARRTGLRRALAEIGVVGRREATREGAQAFRRALEKLGTTYIKLGQLLSSRPDLMPDLYIEKGTMVGHVRLRAARYDASAVDSRLRS